MVQKQPKLPNPHAAISARQRSAGLGPRDVEDAAQLGPVGDAELPAVIGQRPAEHNRGEGHRHGGDAVDGAPAGQPGHHPGERPGQQDADQQAAHQRADHLAALGVTGQRGRVGHQHLDDDRGDRRQRRGHRQQREVRRDGAADQGDGADGEQPGQQRTAAGDVPGGHDEQQPDRVAELARRHQQRRGALADVQRGADRVQQRLRVVQVGDRHRAGHGHQPDQAGRQLAGSRGPARLVPRPPCPPPVLRSPRLDALAIPSRPAANDCLSGNWLAEATIPAERGGCGAAGRAGSGVGGRDSGLLRPP